MPRLTTHALDTAHGRPAAGMRVDLLKDGQVVRSIVTNDDGRADGPLLDGEDVPSGIYELHFHVANYFDALGVECSFLDVVPVRFWTEAGGTYHVPLVFSPWSYSTYRGS